MFIWSLWMQGAISPYTMIFLICFYLRVFARKQREYDGVLEPAVFYRFPYKKNIIYIHTIPQNKTNIRPC